MTKIWTGTIPTECDLCGAPIVDEFIDGNTTLGLWGFLCPSCHATHGMGLGIGRGQRFLKDEEKGWVMSDAFFGRKHQ